MKRAACVVATLLTGSLLAVPPALRVGLGPDGSPVLEWTVGGSGITLESSPSLTGGWQALDGTGVTLTTNGPAVSAREQRTLAGPVFYRLRESVTPPTPNGTAYDIGNPSWHDLFVDPVAGNDDNPGTTRALAFRTIQAAFWSLPEGAQTRATRIRLMPGIHAGAFLEDRRGSADFPILLEPSDGPGTVTLRPTPQGDAGSLQIFRSAYVYVQDFHINVDGGDGLHWENSDHVLARRMRINSRRSEGQDETVKANQSQHVYLEDCDISDAGDNCIDVVAVQYGHIVRCKIHNSSDWGAYLKGGSAYWLIEGNEIYGCGTGGFTAGQGTGFQFMVAPWLHYETYDIKVVNNVIRDCEGAGLGVNGGYNILMAHNTLYRVGSRSHVLEFTHGRRGCDGNDLAACQPYLNAGGWGSTGEEEQFIPNRNVLVVNNVIFNPAPFRSEYQHLEVPGPATPPTGSNVAVPSRADDGLVLRGNVIFNGPADWPLGIEDPDRGCQDGSCTAVQLRSENRFNTLEPTFANPGAGDFRPVGALASLTGVAVPDFTWSDAPTRPEVPAGDLINAVVRDFTGAVRPAGSPPGALLPQP